MLHDVRIAIRSLAKHRGFAAAAIATLALGIGATTTMVSIVYGVLVRPLPYPDAERLVRLAEVVPGGRAAVPGAIISNLTIHAWEPQRRTIGPIAHYGGGGVTVDFDRPVRVDRGAVSPAFFDVLGVPPLRGRFFHPDDAAPGSAPVAVIAEELWRDAFGGAPDVIDRVITIDERPHRIVGVAPRGLTIPSHDTRVWVPARLTPLATEGPQTQVQLTRAIARLAPDATPADAAREGTTLARTMPRPLAAEMLFGKGGPVEVHVRTLADDITAGVRPALLVLLSGVALLLLVACVNVANLFLSRGVSRERDLAIRAALGAGRARLMRETLAEAFVVASAGGILGVGLAWALIQWLPSAAPPNFPRLDDVRLDWPALAAAAALSLGAAMLTGIVPALKSRRLGVVSTLREGSGASLAPRALAAQRALLVAEAALAVMLIIGASLMARSFAQLMATETGYDPSDVLTARIYLPGAGRGEADSTGFTTELLQRVRALPGVTAAGAANMAPFGRSTYVSAFQLPIPGRAPVTARALAYVVTPGYAEALRLRLRSGRLLTEADLASPVAPALVNEEFVRTFLDGVPAEGLRFERQDGLTEIVGVVGNVLKDSLDQPAQPEIFVLAARGERIRREVYLLARVAGDPEDYIEPVRAIVGEVRRDAAIEALEPLEQQLAGSVAQPRVAAAVLVAFASVALLLAAVGLYGVLSYAVARRQREIGVRAALGATRERIVGMIVRDGLVVTGLGLVAGFAGAAALARFMQSVLVGVSALDAMSFAIAGGVMLAAALLATYYPARRATKVDPVVVLRGEL